MATIGALSCAAAIALLSLACRSATSTSQPSIPTQHQAARHAIHSQQLKGIMSGLQSMTFERLPQELAAPKPRSRQLEEAARVAQAMAETAGRITSTLENNPLPQDEETLFRALAGRLSTQANQLQTEAQASDVAGFNATLTEISATCVACHTLFRDLSGPGDSLVPQR